MSPGHPYVGIANGKCELCKFNGECHDIPGLILEPPKTTEEHLVFKIMQEGYKDKAESLQIHNITGGLNHRMTEMLKQMFIHKKGEIDWYTTYHLRVKAQIGYERQEKFKRDRG
jgi:hypothetical protein